MLVLMVTWSLPFVVLNLSINNQNEHTMGHGAQYDLEKYLADSEMHRIEEVLRSLRERGFGSIRGFYHVSTWQPRWAEVIDEQLNLLAGFRKFPSSDKKGFLSPQTDDAFMDYGNYIWDKNHRYTSLLEHSEQLIMNVAIQGDDARSFHLVKNLVDEWKRNVPSHVGDKILLHYNRTIPRGSYQQSTPLKRIFLSSDETISEGEYSTIQSLRNYCLEKNARGEKAAVYYFHSKGGCCWKSPHQQTFQNPVADWRELMNSMILEFPSLCLRALDQGYATCGVNYQDGHYSGNFWWTDCDHVANLPPLQDRFDYVSNEFYIHSVHWNENVVRLFGGLCAFSSFHSGVNSYNSVCPRSKYLSRLMDLVIQQQGELSTFAFHQSYQFVQKCQQWRQLKEINDSHNESTSKTYRDQSHDIQQFLETLFQGNPDSIFSERFYSSFAT